MRRRLAAIYFDTADLRLAAGGLTLRRRSGGDDAGWHLKVPAGSNTRSEVRLPLGRATRTVPASLQKMVWARSLGSALRPVAEIVTERTVRRLVDVTGRVVAEVADDRVTARRLLATDGLGDAAGAATSWREIEVELADGGGSGDLLSAVDDRLRERGLREAPSASKLAQVLDVQPGQAAGNGRKLTAKSSAGEVLLAHIREQVQVVQAYDLPVRLDAPDAVHKMRVATRRLRSALTTFKPLFGADVIRPLRDSSKWLAGELGAARDAEVMRDRVRTAVEARGAAGATDPIAAIADDEARSGLPDGPRPCPRRAGRGAVPRPPDGARRAGHRSAADEEGGLSRGQGPAPARRAQLHGRARSWRRPTRSPRGTSGRSCCMTPARGPNAPVMPPSR